MLRKIEIISIILLTISVATLAVVVFGIKRDLAATMEIPASAVAEPSPEPENQSINLEDFLNEAKEYTDARVATIAGLPNPTSRPTQNPMPKTPETYYIPLGSTFETSSTNWVDVPDSSAYIDLVGEYGEAAKAFFEVNLKVAHGNGQAFARIFDETHGIAVAGSEVSTTANSEYKEVGSGELAIWRGRNLYKVQVKSLNSFVVTQSGAKLKVTNR